MFRKNPEKKLNENTCSEKKSEQQYMRTDDPKKPRKKYMRTDDPIKKTQRKRYKHSIRRQVLQIKTTARDCANVQYENKGLNKNKQQKKKPSEVDDNFQLWFMCMH